MSEIYFYKWVVTSQVFFRSKYCYALVNVRPLVPGHVLVVPLRTLVLRLADLLWEELTDYMNTIQLIHKFIQQTYKADALNIAIQDGPELGQLVPHLHTHIIPRHKDDGWGDSIYKALEQLDLEEEYKEFFARKKAYRDHHGAELEQKDADRVDRSAEDMAQETESLRRQLSAYIADIDRQRREDAVATHFDFERVLHDKSY